MDSTKNYVTCTQCRKRTRRTGKKELILKTDHGDRIYDREYACPHCGSYQWHNEYTNTIH